MYLDLYVERRSNFAQNLAITDVVTNTSINIASAIFTGNVRQYYGSSNLAASFICTPLNTANGVLNFALSADQTGAMKPGRYVYSVVMTLNNLTRRVVEGQLIVLGSVD